MKRTLVALGVVGLAGAISGVATPSGSISRGTHPGGTVAARVRIPAGTGGLAEGEGAVWTMSDAVSTLMRIDPDRNRVTARIKIALTNACPAEPPGCDEVAAGDGAVWVSHTTDNTVSRIDPATNRVIATIDVGPQPRGIAVSPGAVWVANSGDPRGGPSVSRIDPGTNQVIATIRVGPVSACCSTFMELTVGGGSVWVSVPNLKSLVRIDPATNSVSATISLRAQPNGFLAADKRAVWVAAAHAKSVVWQIDPRTNRPTGTVKGTVTPIGLTLGSGSLCVADLDARMIDRVNPHTATIVGRVQLGGGYPVRLAFGLGSIWVRDDTGRVLRIKPQP